jgi:hypothetical protein
MRRVIVGAAAMAASAGVAQGQGEKGQWWPVQNIPGCLMWNPAPEPEETATWSGSCAAGKAEGPGTVILALPIRATPTNRSLSTALSPL